MKWSTNTSIQRLPLAVSGIGPTKSIATFCQGRPACSLCFPCAPLVPPCLAAWQISQLLTILLTIAVIPGQYQVSWSLLVVLTTPEWARAWVVHTMWPLSDGGHMAHHLDFPCGATLASRTPSGRSRSEPRILFNLFSSALPESSCSEVTSTSSWRAL